MSAEIIRENFERLCRQLPPVKLIVSVCHKDVMKYFRQELKSFRERHKGFLLSASLDSAESDPFQVCFYLFSPRAGANHELRREVAEEVCEWSEKAAIAVLGFKGRENEACNHWWGWLARQRPGQWHGIIPIRESIETIRAAWEAPQLRLNHRDISNLAYESMAAIDELRQERRSQDERPEPAKIVRGFMSRRELADAFGIPPNRRNAFFKKLDRKRSKFELERESWEPVSDPSPNGPRFRYRADTPAVRELAAHYMK